MAGADDRVAVLAQNRLDHGPGWVDQRPSLTLIRVVLPSIQLQAVRGLSVSTGVSYGRLLEEGVALFLASRGTSAPRRGLRSLPRGRRPVCAETDGDDLPIVIMDDAEDLHYSQEPQAVA